MDVLLTAVRVRGSGEHLRSAGIGGMTLTSEPVEALIDSRTLKERCSLAAHTEIQQTQEL